MVQPQRLHHNRIICRQQKKSPGPETGAFWLCTPVAGQAAG